MDTVETVTLGEVELPDGVLVILDPGLGRFWRHDGPPDSPAAELGARELGGGSFGWRDVPMAEVSRYAEPVQARIARDGLGVGVDYRPHCNLERLNSQLRESTEDVGTLTLAGARALGLGNRWGDGIFAVSRDLDVRGRTLRVRVELGTPERKALLARIKRLQLGAIATRYVSEGAHPVRFAERMEPHNPRDSGWAFSAGVEDDAYMDDARNMVVLPLSQLVQRFPELEPILDAPVGALYHREGERFVVDED